MTITTHETPGATNTEGFNSTATCTDNERNENIMSQADQQHEDVQHDRSDYRIDVRQDDSPNRDWSRRENGDFFWIYYSVTIIDAQQVIVVRLFTEREDMKARALSFAKTLRDGTAFDEVSLDDFETNVYMDDTTAYRLRFGWERPADTCDRDGCVDKGEEYPDGDHVCHLDLPKTITDYGVSIFFDLDDAKWLIDVNIADDDYLGAEEARRTASALAEAAALCDRHNGAEIRRPVAACAAPEHEGLV